MFLKFIQLFNIKTFVQLITTNELLKLRKLKNVQQKYFHDL